MIPAIMKGKTVNKILTTTIEYNQIKKSLLRVFVCDYLSKALNKIETMSSYQF